MRWLDQLFGDPNAREIAKCKPIIAAINGQEARVKNLSAEQLQAQTASFKQRLAAGETLDDLLPEAFAAVREAARRTHQMRHFDVQLMGGIALHHGIIAEMRTGEGKTLVATAPLYLNALTGKGTHLVTVNDYLARRDAVWMGQIYHALGMSVGCIQHAGSFIYDPAFRHEPEHGAEVDATGSFRVDMDYLRPVSRREAYQADITYGTNNEFGFDYLRDNMVTRLDEMVQRPLHFAVVDEVDSILIDEARTPLIISAPAEEATDSYYQFAELVAKLIEKEDYHVDEKLRAATLTESGIAKMENWLQVENLYLQGGMRLVHHVEQALKAHALYKKDRDYVVKDNEVVIVDEFTGRLMFGRRYSEGLHQAIEAKERVQIQRESITLATITFQNYFRLYQKLAGMTGTAVTEAEEFYKIYHLDVLAIPTHRANHRQDLSDRVYKNQLGKFQAVVKEIKERHAKGQPVLVGTVSIEKNEILSQMLSLAAIPHAVLNAKNHEREAEIIAQAGHQGSVTVATNMAGRGVDIILGGQPADPAEAEAVKQAGGLFVLGTERHESRRIDNQLRGRSGRQGDPGATQFYVSMEDDLMRIFGSDRMKGMMDRLGVPDDEPIENSVLSRSIAAAQRKVEGHNFDIRKHLLEYDDVLNKHRSVIYKKRREILERSMEPSQEGERPTKAKVVEAIREDIQQMAATHLAADDLSAWDAPAFEKELKSLFPEDLAWEPLPMPNVAMDARRDEDVVDQRQRMTAAALRLMDRAYALVEETVGDRTLMAEIEKAILLRSIDDLWIEHLEAMDHLRHGIGLQGYGQRDPLVEYKKEAYRFFQQLQLSINQRVSRTIFKVQAAKEIAEEELQNMNPLARPLQLSAPVKELTDNASATATPSTATAADKVGRNDACPCGSGKKYKKCHGAT